MNTFKRSNKFKQTNLVLRVVTFILAPFLLFSSKMHPWQEKEESNTWAHNITYPVEYTLHIVKTFVLENVNHYINLSHAAKENTILKREIFQLKAKAVLNYQQNIQEIKRLRKLIGFTHDVVQSQILAAEVIGHYDFFSFQSFRVSKGQKNGVRPGMPVIAADGLIGKIIRTGTYHSDVQIISDGNFVLDIFVERTRVRAILHGTNDNYCQFQLNRRANIKIGDTIISSGMLDLFPKGLPVGKVVRISHDVEEVSQIVNVQPWVQANAVEEVIIIQNMQSKYSETKEVVDDSS